MESLRGFGFRYDGYVAIGTNLRVLLRCELIRSGRISNELLVTLFSILRDRKDYKLGLVGLKAGCFEVSVEYGRS